VSPIFRGTAVRRWRSGIKKRPLRVLKEMPSLSLFDLACEDTNRSGSGLSLEPRSLQVSDTVTDKDLRDLKGRPEGAGQEACSI
jgi:hypothetical protein